MNVRVRVGNCDFVHCDCEYCYCNILNRMRTEFIDMIKVQVAFILATKTVHL